ncbi:hypothetical protein SAMN05518865_12632 [Duganella sp. CF458]|uniref:hypothetical protein n=1 Tax=Duganella sp. CF458 TaxID=1884368 RepID=UPI0008EA0D6D|nr:hypothetical protein [Duganella sp. CF458]SFG97557.1 hypothetical protein SAMN05518865_12632 [Duganella sp. CF458]
MHQAILKLAGGMALALASGAASAQWVTTDIQVTGVIQEIPGPSARCPSKFGGTITGHGSSPLLGRVAFVANDCITPDGPVFNFNRGRFIVMTMSGDQLYANYSGQFVPTGQGSNYVFSGATFQITGGTGQYIFASGGGQLQGSEDMATGAGTITMSGRMSYWKR